MGRNTKKRQAFDYEGRPNVDVEVLIARDPMMGLDSDEEIDLGGSVLPAASVTGSRNSDRRDSFSSSSSNQKTKRKRNNSKKKDKKKDADVNEDGVDNEEVFYVEKIKDKRWNNGRWEWLLQWQGYGPEFDTWEPTENMDCDDLLQEFEAVWKNKPKYGFDRGLIAREIVGICIVKGKPMFLVLYKGSDDAEFVPTKECTRKCPSLVIEFYENRQIAKPEEDLDDKDNPHAPPTLHKQVGA